MAYNTNISNITDGENAEATIANRPHDKLLENTNYLKTTAEAEHNTSGKHTTVKLDDGLVGSPSLTFSETDTGLYQIGADNVGLSLGGTLRYDFGASFQATLAGNYVITQNSVNVFTSINASAVVNTLYLNAGNVAIGTTGPLGALTTGKKLSILDSTNTAIIELGKSTTADETLVGIISFMNTDNSDAGAATRRDLVQLRALTETTDSNAGDDSGGHLVIYTKPEAGTIAERVRITSVGDTGFNTATPRAKVDVLSTTGEQFRLSFADNTKYCGLTLDTDGNLTVIVTGTGVIIRQFLALGSVSANVAAQLTLDGGSEIAVDTADGSDASTLSISGGGLYGVGRGAGIKFYGTDHATGSIAGTLEMTGNPRGTGSTVAQRDGIHLTVTESANQICTLNAITIDITGTAESDVNGIKLNNPSVGGNPAIAMIRLGTSFYTTGSNTPTMGANSPTTGAPAQWVFINLNGTMYTIPAWLVP